MKKICSLVVAALIGISTTLGFSQSAQAYTFEKGYESWFEIERYVGRSHMIACEFEDANKVDSWIFRAPVTGDYYFESFDKAERLDPYGAVYEEATEKRIGYNDDGGESLNFSLSVHLEAGTIYRLAVGNYRANVNPRNYKLLIVVPKAQ